MNDENLVKCADHGGDWGFSCGFWAKYPSLADEHIKRAHTGDPKGLQLLSRYRTEDNELYRSLGEGGITPTFNPEDFQPDPLVTELRKRPMSSTAFANVALLAIAYLIGLAVIALIVGAVVWFIHAVWVLFGG